MKILHINRDYGDNGGAEQYLRSLCDALEQGGHQTAVIYGRRDANTWDVPAKSRYFVSGIHEFSKRSAGRVLEDCLKIVRKERPDVINLHISFNPNLMLELGRRWPVVQSIHSSHPYCLRSKFFQSTRTACDLPLGYHCLTGAYLKRCADPRPWNLIRAWRRCNAEIQSGRRAQSLIVFSKYMKSCLVQNRIEENRVSVVPYFTDAGPSTGANGESDDNIVLYVGRITKEKGLDDLLRAVKEIKMSYQLLIVGDGWYSAKIKALAQQLDLAGRVRFTGWISNNNLEEYYRKASMLVIPSAWPEPFGIVGLEAMAHSKPVVAFDVGGIADWLDHRSTGFLVEPRNIGEMAGRIEQLLEDRELAARMGFNGRKKVEQEFSASNHLENLMNIYRSAQGAN